MGPVPPPPPPPPGALKLGREALSPSRPPPPGALKLGREALSPDVHDALAAFVLDMEGAEVGLAGTLLAGLPCLGLTMQARLYLMVGLCWVGWLIG